MICIILLNNSAFLREPFVKWFALCYRTVVCLSVTLVYCGQMVRWIKMKLGMEVGLCPSYTASDGTQLPHRGTDPPIFGPCLLWPNGWMDQDATWYGGRSRPRPHCIRWGPSSPLQKGHSSPPFWPMSTVAKRSPISAIAQHLSYLPK